MPTSTYLVRLQTQKEESEFEADFADFLGNCEVFDFYKVNWERLYF